LSTALTPDPFPKDYFPVSGEVDANGCLLDLLLARGGLFVGSSGNGNIIFTQPSGDQDSVVVAAGVKQLSGLAIDATGTLYYASRHDQQVYELKLAQGPVAAEAAAKGQPYGPQLRQAPEFIACAPASP
jgi:hypothetical protein